MNTTPCKKCGKPKKRGTTCFTCFPRQDIVLTKASRTLIVAPEPRR